jgi:hypothetical protein
VFKAVSAANTLQLNGYPTINHSNTSALYKSNLSGLTIPTYFLFPSFPLRKQSNSNNTGASTYIFEQNLFGIKVKKNLKYMILSESRRRTRSNALHAETEAEFL